MSNLFQKLPVSVDRDGALVVLTIGNRRWSIEFHRALQISAALRAQAAIAKIQSGDLSRRPRAFGILTDLNAPSPRRRRFAEKLPELLGPHGIEVIAKGSLVVLRFGRDAIDLPYAVAQTLSQWLRVHAKGAMRHEGEKKRWSEIDGAAAAFHSGRVA